MLVQRQTGVFQPRGTAALEQVYRTLVSPPAWRADGDQLAVRCHGLTEEGEGLRVRSLQTTVQRPSAGALAVHPRDAGVGLLTVGTERSRDQQAAGNRDRRA